MKTNAAKDIILRNIQNKLEVLKQKPSQWKIKKERGCICKKKYVEMTHEHDPEKMDILLENEKVKDFTQAGGNNKIYAVEGQYVRASYGGVNIEEISGSTSDLCYELKNENSVKIGRIRGIKELPDANKGAITVSLDWENVDVNLDLDVRWDVGEYDIQDVTCPKEHWFIENKSSVTEGKRAIWVNLKESSSDDTNVSDKVSIFINALGKTMPLVVDINEEGDYAVGHVADIIIEYIDHKYVPRLEFIPKVNVHVGRGGGGKERKAPTCQEQYGEYNCECMPCSAKIIPYLEQALAGPLSGAVFKIYKASDYTKDIALYSGTTSTGSDVLTAGIIDVPKSMTNTLDDNTLYVIEARGGTDIDSNDDYITDGIDVVNDGSFRALVLGKDLKTHGYKINILTEIMYQVVKNKIGTTPDMELRGELNDIATYLLDASIYGGEITYSDIIEWLPTLDKKLLFYTYDEYFESIVQKIYKDQDIYDDAIALVYGTIARPRLKGLYLNVSEAIENSAYVGAVEVVSEGNSSIHGFSLSGEQSSDFRIDLEGKIYVSVDANIDFETKKSYALKATAINADGNTTVSVNIDIVDAYDAPVAKGYEGGILFSTAKSGEWVAKVVFDQGKAPIITMELIGEEARYFDINTSGDISVSALGLPLLANNVKFHFNVIASNSYGESLPAGITLHINKVKDTPSIHGFSARINEHSPENTFIHTVSFDKGSATIDGFVLSGEGSENFSIDVNGTMRVSKNADLDYEKKNSYRLSLGARNVYGESENVAVTLLLNDVLDTPVLESNQTFIVDENITSSFVLGNILKEEGLSAIESITLSSSLFRVDLEGNVYVAEGRELDFETRQFHSVIATAINSYGHSLPVEFIVQVQDVIDVATLSSFSTTIVEHSTALTPLGKINYTQGTSQVILFQLAGVGREKFEVDKEGIIIVVNGVDFDYEEVSQYTLSIRALNASGYSNSVDFNVSIENILDAPELQGLQWTIDENTNNITLNGNIILNEGLTSVNKIVVRDSEGNISTDIEVSLDGKVHVLANADLDYEIKSILAYTVIAYNEQGFSNKITLRLTLKNVLDAPEIENFSGSIDENVAIGTVVGKLSFNKGLSDVSGIILKLPQGVEYINPFMVDSNGTIRVKSKLDYEKISQYRLFAYATNEQGRSTGALVNIEIFDSADGPILNNFSGKISEDAEAGTLVGVITYEDGLDPITSMSLSGVGSENFTIDKQGTITLAIGASLDYEIVLEYHFWAQAFSLGDNSNIVDINITVLDVNEQARVGMGIWENANVKIYELLADGNRTLLYEEVSSSSSEYNKSGLFDSHRLELDSDKFYIYEVSGGVERDINQDGVLDENTTQNFGTLYAITKGAWIRQMDKLLSVNLMTDVFYKWLKDDINRGDFVSLEAKLQEKNNPIISRDIDGISLDPQWWWYGDGRDALVYSPLEDQYKWTNRFSYASKKFMKKIILEESKAYDHYIKNLLKYSGYNRQLVARNKSALSEDKKYFYSIMDMNSDKGIKSIDLFLETENIFPEDNIEQILIDDAKSIMYALKYISYGEGGTYHLKSYDISTPTILTELATIDIGSDRRTTLFLSNDKNKIYCIEEGKVITINVEDPVNPSMANLTFNGVEGTNKVEISHNDKYIYLAQLQAGLWIVDKYSFEVLGYYIAQGNVVDLKENIVDNTLHVLVSNDVNSSLKTVDINDTSTPNVIATRELNCSDSTTFTFNDDRSLLLLSCENSTLKIYSYSEDTSIDLVLHATLLADSYGGSIEAIMFMDTSKIIITTEYFVFIYDISDLSNPLLLEKYQTEIIPG